MPTSPLRAESEPLDLLGMAWRMRRSTSLEMERRLAQWRDRRDALRAGPRGWSRKAVSFRSYGCDIRYVALVDLGYARVSTVKQDLDRQVEELAEGADHGVDRWVGPLTSRSKRSGFRIRSRWPPGSSVRATRHLDLWGEVWAGPDPAGTGGGSGFALVVALIVQRLFDGSRFGIVGWIA